MMKTWTTLALALAALAATVTAQAQAPRATTDDPARPAARAVDAARPAQDAIDGEVRKIDLEARKLTLRHGPIPAFDMPGMTMVFQVRDPKVLDGLKVGDKVTFKADKINGQFTVTELQPAR